MISHDVRIEKRQGDDARVGQAGIATEDGRGERRPALPIRVPIKLSSCHAHLTASIIEQLFCDHYKLHPTGEFLQGHQYATLESVTLVGPEGRLLKVPVVGPASTVNQIEISRSDAMTLGVRAAVRESGDLIGTPGIIVEGPRSQVSLGTGLICALRHIHMNSHDAERFGFKDRDRVEVATEGNDRRIIFRDVLLRVAPRSSLELHLDCDEANAAGLRGGDFATLTLSGDR
jgi:propanediol utilization protein